MEASTPLESACNGPPRVARLDRDGILSVMATLATSKRLKFKAVQAQ
jgi:hypothetical protein